MEVGKSNFLVGIPSVREGVGWVQYPTYSVVGPVVAAPGMAAVALETVVMEFVVGNLN